MRVFPPSYPWVSIPAAFVLALGGCVTEPRYKYVEQKDSACVEGPTSPIQNSENGNCAIDIIQVDGVMAGFTASCPGLNWFAIKKPLYFAPGKHTLKLSISQNYSEMGDVGHGRTGAVGDFTAGGQPTITVVLTGSHVYRLAAYLAGNSIDLALWDLSADPALRVRVASWILDSNGGYTERIPAVHNR